MTDEPSKKVDEPVDELEARAEALRQAALKEGSKSRMPSPGDMADSFETRLKLLEDDARETKRNHRKLLPKAESESSTNRSDSVGLGAGLAIAYSIIGLPMAGILIGWAIDSRTGDHVWKGIGAMVGIGVGVFYAVILLNRANKNL